MRRPDGQPLSASEPLGMTAGQPPPRALLSVRIKIDQAPRCLRTEIWTAVRRRIVIALLANPRQSPARACVGA